MAVPGAQHHRQAGSGRVEPLGESRSDGQVVFDLATRLGFGDRFWNGSIESGLAAILEPLGLSLDDTLTRLNALKQALSLVINVGMWFERFVIIAVSLHRDFIPGSWSMYTPTWVDWGLLFGSMATFGVLFLLFLRFLPVVPIAEVKELRRELDHHDAQAGHGAAGAEVHP